MDQEEGAGHHVITQKAVENVYASGRSVGGIPEEDFYKLLDGAQEYMDRWYGPTVLPHWLDEADQREHGMAAANLTGAENVARNRAWVEDNTVQALLAEHNGKLADMMKALGAAVHALEDSYSEAHEFRDPSEHQGNPEAKIESLNVFDPTGVSGGGGVVTGTEGTHEERFDKVPLDAAGDVVVGDDKAAVAAVTQLLEKFADEQDAENATAKQAISEVVARFYQMADRGTTVNLHPDAAWQQDRDDRVATDDAQVAAAAATTPPNLGFGGDPSSDTSSPSGGSGFTISWQEVNSGGPCDGYATHIRWYDANDVSNTKEVTVDNSGLAESETASRSYRVDDGIPSGATWRFEISMTAPGFGGSPTVGIELTAS